MSYFPQIKAQNLFERRKSKRRKKKKEKKSSRYSRSFRGQAVYPPRGE